MVQQNFFIFVLFGFQLNEVLVWMGYSEVDWVVSCVLLLEDFWEYYIVIQLMLCWFFKCWCEDWMSVLINVLFVEGYVVVFIFGFDVREKKMVDIIIVGCLQV